jgi:fructose-1-phosphate kinase PfkB-like protein
MEETPNNETKQDKKFEQTFSKLVAICGGKEKLAFPKAVPNDSVQSLVEDLFKEEKEALLKQTKEDLRNLLKQYAEMNKLFKEKEKELATLHKQKKEEFVKSAEAVFKKIEDVGELDKQYYEGLTEVTK